MELSLSKEDLQYFISSQLEYRFPDRKSGLDFNDPLNKLAFEDCLGRVENCFQHIKVRGYSKISGGGIPYFNHLNMDQYSQFLYYFSNAIWMRGGNEDICSKLVLLNRELSGCWFSYKGKLPDIFILMHPVGSVIGHRNVVFSDYLVIMQNITINGTTSELKLGEALFIGAGAKIIGGGMIGDRVSIGANTLVRNPHIQDDHIIYQDTETGVVTQKLNQKDYCFAEKYFYIA